jgi:integrase
MKDVSRPYLSEEELNRLMAMSIRFDCLGRVRDLFLFACFTGLSYADVKKLKRSEIEIMSEGVWIKTKRQKTGGTVNVPLLEVPWKII